MKKKLPKNTPQKSARPAANPAKVFKPGSALYLVLLGVIIAFVLIVRLQFLHIPFERDEGTYCYMGQLVLDGKVPYIGFYDMKPPLLYYSYAALLLVFGRTVEAMHVAFMLLNILTIILMYFTGKKLLSSRSAGLVTAAAYAILSLAPFVAGFTVQSEHIISFFVTAAILLLLTGLEKKKLYYLFFSGLLFSLGFLIKQNGVFFLAFGGLAIVIYSLLKRPVEWKSLVINVAVFSLGALVVFPVIIGLLYHQGALQQCLYWTWYYPQEYVSVVTSQEGVTNFNRIAGNIIDKNLLLWLLAGAGFILSFFSGKYLSLFTRIFIWLFVALSFLAITPGLRFFGHYCIFFMPAAALLVGVGVVCVKDMLHKYFAVNISGIIALSIFGLAILYNLAQQRDYYFNPDDRAVLRMVYQMNPFPEAKVVGDYIKQNSTERDSIGIFGSEPEIYFYADRRCPSKHEDGYAMLSGSPEAKVFQKEYERDMETSLPRYFVAFKNPASFSVFKSDTPILNWLNAFLATKYNVIGIIDMLSENNTQYVWGDDVNRYKVKSEFSGYVFERKKTN